MDKNNYKALYGIDSTGTIVNLDKDKKIIVAPTPLVSGVEYQDVGQDMNLRKDVSAFYLVKTIEWIEKDKDFKSLKKRLRILKSNKGLELIYNLLRLLVRNGKANWYDLRDSWNYPIVKEFLKYKLQ